MAIYSIIYLFILAEKKPQLQDPTADERKKDHISLAFESQTPETDPRFYYEPILSAFPATTNSISCDFVNKKMQAPMWVSSMTGGTALAKTININLAKACKEFGIGMGLGSCRSLLYDHNRLSDFDMRSYIGNQPLYANLGIAQVEELVACDQTDKIAALLELLQADGLIIHVNPLQEWLQPEGDIIKNKPIDTIQSILAKISSPIIVKEVGQGMGYESLKALLQLPIAALDFGAHGGTNFSKLEILRSEDAQKYLEWTNVGHTAKEMVALCNQLYEELGDRRKCSQLIISGGVKTHLDGYYLISKSKINAIYGQASPFLKHAMGDYKDLQKYVKSQVEGLEMANAFLRIR